MSNATKEETQQISIRPNREMYELLKAEAKRERRSMNQQTLEILYQHFYGAPSQ